MRLTTSLPADAPLAQVTQLAQAAPDGLSSWAWRLLLLAMLLAALVVAIRAYRANRDR